jgi:hypothetical protein
MGLVKQADAAKATATKNGLELTPMVSAMEMATGARSAAVALLDIPAVSIVVMTYRHARTA